MLSEPPDRYIDLGCIVHSVHSSRRSICKVCASVAETIAFSRGKSKCDNARYRSDYNKVICREYVEYNPHCGWLLGRVVFSS